MPEAAAIWPSLGLLLRLLLQQSPNSPVAMLTNIAVFGNLIPLDLILVKETSDFESDH